MPPTATTGNTWAVEASCTTVVDEFQQVVGIVTVDHASTGEIIFDLRKQDIRKIGSSQIQSGANGSPFTATVEFDQDAVSDHVGVEFTGTSIDALAVEFSGTYSTAQVLPVVAVGVRQTSSPSVAAAEVFRLPITA